VTIERLKALSAKAALALAKAVEEYLSEIDNPAPDYSYRRVLRDRMRAALAALEEKQNGD